MRIVEYVILFDEGVRKRHIHKSEKKEITEFLVQLEVRAGEQWMPVVRYDCSHRFSHVDLYDQGGAKTKMALTLGFNEVLILADEDIKENWRKYAADFIEER